MEALPRWFKYDGCESVVASMFGLGMDVAGCPCRGAWDDVGAELAKWVNMYRFLHQVRIQVQRALIALLVMQGLPAMAAAVPPNVVLIISDDQAWWDYGFMGSKQVDTPRLDRLASESATFVRGYVPTSLCCPSLVSILTGQYAWRHTITGNDPAKPEEESARGAGTTGREILNRRMDRMATLPRVLGEAGYMSLQTGKWWQGDYTRGGFTHGMTKGTRHGDEGLKIGRETMQPIYDFIGEAQRERKPFFVWYAPFLPHEPHTPPKDLLEKYKARTDSLPMARYFAMCEWLDRTCGELMDHLDMKGLRENTIVALVTDNGWRQSAARAGVEPRSKLWPNDGGVRTPILFRWPGRIDPGVRQMPVSSTDIAPTLLAAAGVKVPGGMQGKALFTSGSNGSKLVEERNRGPVFGETYTHDMWDLAQPHRSLLWRWVVDGEHKLIVPVTADGRAMEEIPGDRRVTELFRTALAKARPELYEVTNDPDEERDLAGSKPDVVKVLRARLDAWWDGRSSPAFAGPDGVYWLQRAPIYLGEPTTREWDDQLSVASGGTVFERSFLVDGEPVESVLRIRQEDVRANWGVEVNGKKLGNLTQQDAALAKVFPVPASALVRGVNVVRVRPPAGKDGIVVSEVRVEPRGAEGLLSEGGLDVRVRMRGGARVPCRVTVVDGTGALAPFSGGVGSSPGRAVRQGVVYTLDGDASVRLPAGEYEVFGGRGFEYSLARKRVKVGVGPSEVVELEIEREVPTEGWVAVDPHIHTKSFSGHGDAMVEERLVTIAGEGIEVPIATDHNHHADYEDHSEKAGLGAKSRWYTPIRGNEFTTKLGHFNVFPVRKGEAVPKADIASWKEVGARLRGLSETEVIQLNHPRDIFNGFQPLGPGQIDGLTGEPVGAHVFEFDAVEVANSGSLQSDIMVSVRDWMALVNRGHRVTATGSSDSHEVSRYIVGQGRTYARASDVDPAEIPKEDVYRAFKEGRAVVSMGLFCDVKVASKYGPGDLVPRDGLGFGGSVTVDVTVLGPRWVSADRVEVFVNGRSHGVREIVSADGVKKAEVQWTLRGLRSDAAVVVVASGPGVTQPYWDLPRPYQATSTHHVSRVLSLNNPVFVDVDGDGRFTAPFARAQAIADKHGKDEAKAWSEALREDVSVAEQLQSVLRPRIATRTSE